MAEYVLQEVDKENLDKLEALSFIKIDERYAPEAFGNSYATLSNQALSVMLVRDRRDHSQISLRVALPSDIDNGWELEHVLELVQGADRDLALLSQPTATQIVECFLKYYPAISNLFSPANFDNTNARLKALGAQRFENMMAKWKIQP